METLFSYTNAGIKKVRDNPQLTYTVIVALIIVGSFVFMADRFIAIADDAQERLINVRVGSIHDAFVPFAADNMEARGYLNAKIADIVDSNETIRSFRVLAKPESGGYYVIASNDPVETGADYSGDELMFSFASSQPSQSMTFEVMEGGERFFKTVRAIPDGSGGVAGMVMTVQTLSAADRVIQNNIENSIYLLVVVIVVIVFLFLRHARIVDYMTLYEKLKQVDQLKDDFISMASHELRTPLTVIRGYAEFIREAPDLTPETKDYAAKIDVSAESLDSLVSDILDVSRIQQGRMSYKLEKLDPLTVLKQVVTSLDVAAREKGLELSLDAASAGGHLIEVDPGRLRQVLVNIIGNAVKYTEKGSVKVSHYIESGQAFIRVSDTGIGISAEERERLFEKFYRVKNKETENIRGTGLGLWITAQIVKEMNGRISVESIKSVGSHFIISFPVAA